MQNKVDRETRFNNEFDQFVTKPGEALVSVYNRFVQLMNDLERNDIIFLNVTVNTKFLKCLQPEWLKYATQVRLAKRLIKDTYDDLFDYLHQFEKLVNASRAKKVEKSHDPLALVAHMGSSSRTTTPYYVTHPSSVVDYDEDYQGDAVQNNSEDPLTSRTLQTTSLGTIANVQCYNCSEKGHYAWNYPKPRVRDSRIQPTNFDSDKGPSYDSAFLSEVQTPSTNYVNPLFAKVTETSSLVNHNAYMASSSAPQIDYALMVQQSSEYSPPEAGLVGRQNFMSAGLSRPFTSGSGGAPGKQRVIVCYNCKDEGHMSKQYTKPKRKRDA
nr:hypothetical protein [Tanacetum cinerariifolium]